MISAAIKSLQQMFSAPFRNVFFKALGLTIALFIGLTLLIQIGLTALTFSTIGWVDTAASWVAGVSAFAAIVFASYFLTGPVTALFAGLFLDDIAVRVEKKHYAGDPPGAPVPAWPAMLMALQFAALVLAVHITMVPFFVVGLGAIGLVTGNAYLLSREYFEITGMRHLPKAEVAELRKRNAGRVFAAGLIPAALAMIPFGNLLMPVFITAYMTHIFKTVQRTDPVAVTG